jgi:hypothetical protein
VARRAAEHNQAHLLFFLAAGVTVAGVAAAAGIPAAAASSSGLLLVSLLLLVLVLLIFAAALMQPDCLVQFCLSYQQQSICLLVSLGVAVRWSTATGCVLHFLQNSEKQQADKPEAP